MATSGVKSSEQRFMEHRKLALTHVDQALKMDENRSGNQLDDNKKQNILKLYKKGVHEMKAALRLSSEPFSEDVKKYQQSMKTTLSKVKSRIQELSGNSVMDAVVTPKTGIVPRSSNNISARKTNIPNDVTFGASKSRRVLPRRPATPNVSNGVEQKFLDIIRSEVVTELPAGISFDTIAGQVTAKQALKEMVILPALRPDLLTNLRSPSRGILLFGPPGNGKTLLAKAVAAESKVTFLSISASTLTSKWIGEGEKLVRALFVVARELQPSLIFIDEIDSLLSKRKENEHESSRRLKTEFFLQFDGIQAGSNSDRVLIMGATNRPDELDDAILRRLPKRIHVQLPDQDARRELLAHLLKKQENTLSRDELTRLAGLTEGYSGSDLSALAKDAAMRAVRELPVEQLKKVRTLRKVTFQDFVLSTKSVRPSVPSSTLRMYQDWNSQFGDIS